MLNSVGERDATLWNASFKLTLFGCVISICCVGFASLDVVCVELNDCAWNVYRYQLSDECVYVYCVKSFAHIECYSDCSRRGSHLVESFCYGVI